jgi:rubrerythrin
MFTPQQYLAKAVEYTDLAKATNKPAEVLEFEALGRSFRTLADNEQWLADNHHNTVHAGEGAVDTRAVAEEEGVRPSLSGGGSDHAVEHTAAKATAGAFR